jgi:hypothetical protein
LVQIAGFEHLVTADWLLLTIDRRVGMAE